MFIFGLNSGLNVYRLENGESYAVQNGGRVASSKSYIALLKELRKKRFISGDEYVARLKEYMESKSI